MLIKAECCVCGGELHLSQSGHDERNRLIDEYRCKNECTVREVADE